MESTSHDNGGPEREPTLSLVLATLVKRELWGNFLVLGLAFVPGAVLIGIMARRLDYLSGWAPLPGPPWNYLLSVGFILTGTAIVVYTYGYLYIMGKGSPGSHMGYTQRLVTTGIFSLARHPSVVGKLFGVIGLAFFMRSPSFLVIIIPILFLYSFTTMILIQERFCVRNFGEAYTQYCREVPMYVPRLGRILQLLRQRSAR